MKPFITILFAFVLMLNHAFVCAATSVLFIGNSFTFGYGSATKHYRADSVTDLNNESIGGVPALFKSFTKQAGLNYDVYLETRGGSDFNYHLENKLKIIGTQPWDQVVMHSYSTMDSENPGVSTALVQSTAKLAEFLHSLNPKVEVYITATWSRPDLIYKADRHWSGTPIEKMALDVRAGYDQAAQTPFVKGVNAVGQAWNQAMKIGIADPNPYDGIEFGKVSLWTWDHYHGSNYGYYLHALMAFGNLTGLDPRSLGENECSGFELGMSQHQITMLQQAAFEQLISENRVTPAPLKKSTESSYPKGCNAI
ncbi:PEP-CTERM sorting domain-containing protein [Paraglaciecola arctica]|uniref:PEP-CTERM sorting domain-containing protein n=1 Tax=Paraglaciecola arctica TaxID=1128911 RepID=UPI001C0788C2|nr:PEP-CTERM sorting domain-containing protein [Paraglaciecola arctica]MBU3002014.1 PEP-CTERM sorting domain-containing protein [Paraglaciecola arctica]